jgi:MFS family permease
MIIEKDNSVEANISMLILGIFQVFTTLASGCLINRYGRRPLMMIGHTIVIVSLLLGFLVTSIF